MIQKWKKVEYTRREINEAGDSFRNGEVVSTRSREIVENWRAAHAYPMHVIYIHLRGMANNKNGFLVVERLKRLESIIDKIKREKDMQLWRMQDLGGCRFIVQTVNEVYQYAEKYKKSRIRHELKREYDYIKQPKKSGYRSLHLVYKFHSDKKEEYNKNMLIEIQFRTYLQHLWSTAVETMGVFKKQNLKSGKGSPQVREFFALVSSLFAMEEGTSLVPGTPENREELILSIKKIDDEYHLIRQLDAIQAASMYDETHGKGKGYYILVLNYNEGSVRIKHFMPSDFEEANKAYGKLEEINKENTMDIVLVRAESFGALKSAYSNYFTDIQTFISRVKGFLKEQSN